MANRIQHLRGSHTEHSTFTGEKGEISLVTDTSANRIPTGELRIHDGSTAGGLPVKLGTTDKPLTDDIYLASGTGINFSAYATSGNPSSNLLDDYEEGTWTPITSSGTWSVSQAQTVYTKVGRMVTCNFFITATSDVSAVDFTGLPFVPSTEAGGVCGYQNQDVNNVYTIYVQAANVWNIRQGSYQRGLSNNKTMRGTFSYVTNS